MDKYDLRKQYEQETGFTPCIIKLEVDSYGKEVPPSYTEWLEILVIKEQQS